MMIIQTHRLVDHSLERRKKTMMISWGGEFTTKPEGDCQVQYRQMYITEPDTMYVLYMVCKAGFGQR